MRSLEAVRDLRRYLTEVERQAVDEARARGASAQDIADALGVTRQAVYYKIGQSPRRQERDGPGKADSPDVAEKTRD